MRLAVEEDHHRKHHIGEAELQAVDMITIEL